MPDVETPAESSPAETTQTQTPKAEPVSVPTNAEDYAEWRLTGKLPEFKPPKRERSATSQPSAGQDPGNSAPVPETGKQRQDRTQSEIRVKELLEERHALRTELEALKAGNTGAQAASPPAPAKSAPAESPPASDASKRPVRPKQDEFKTWEEFETAKDKYDEDLADWKAEQKIQEYEQRRQQETASQAMQVRLNEAKTRYGDEAEPRIMKTAQTVFDDKAVAPAVKHAIGRSDVMVDALYVMGSDADELKAFTELAIKDPLEALRKWFTVEALVKAELSKPGNTNGSTPPRGEDGKFLSSEPPPAKPPAKKAPPSPPIELGANSSPPGDERDRAAATGNVRKFFEEGNRRDMARMKGQ